VNIGDLYFSFRGESKKLEADAKLAGQKAGKQLAKGMGGKGKGSLSQTLKTGLGIGAGIGVFSLVTAGVKGVANAVGDTIDAATQFEDQLRTINTVAGVTDEQLSAIGDDIQELARETGKTTSDLTSGFYDLVSAGVPAEQAISVLRDSAILATGALSTTGEAVDLVTTALNAYGMEASESTKVTDIFAKTVERGKVTAAELGASLFNIAPIAASAGVSLEEVGAAYAQMTAQGVPAAQAATQMRSAISAILKPNAEMNKLQKQTGLNLQELMRSEGVAAAMEALTDATGGNATAMTKALGRIESYQFALAVTGENAVGFAENLAAVTDAADEGGVAMSKYLEKSQSLAERQRRLAAEIETLMQDVGGLLQPVLEGIVLVAGEAIQKVRELAEVLDKVITTASDIVDPARKVTRALEDMNVDPVAMAWIDAERDRIKLIEDTEDALKRLNLTDDETKNHRAVLAGFAETVGDVAAVAEVASTEMDNWAGVLATSNAEVRASQLNDMYESMAHAVGLIEPRADDAADGLAGLTAEQKDAVKWLLRYDAAFPELEVAQEAQLQSLVRLTSATGEHTDATEDDTDATDDNTLSAKKLQAITERMAAETFPDIKSAAKSAQKAIQNAFKTEPLVALRKERNKLIELEAKARRQRDWDALVLIQQRRAIVDQSIKDRRQQARHYEQEAEEERKRRKWARLRKRAIEVMTEKHGKTREEAEKLWELWRRKWKLHLDDSELEDAIEDAKELLAYMRETGMAPGGRVKGGGGVGVAAEGGPTIAGRTYLVGEEGPELHVPRRDGYIIDAAQTAAITAGSGTTHHEHTISVEGAMALHAAGYDEAGVAEIFASAVGLSESRYTDPRRS
jgi:TP901 family phage tail tape measure protein